MSHSVKEIDLKEIATIRTGYSFRGKIESGFDSSFIPVVQPKDITGDFSPARMDRQLISNYQNHALQKDEILIANKGVKFSTYLIDAELIGGVASSSFFVISPDVNKIIPDFLIWYLTQDEALNYLKSSSIASTIPSLNKKSLESLTIALPPIDVQEKVVHMKELVQTEELELLNLIQTRKELLKSYAFEQIHTR
ncbi:restriction endonuclease subunit S [Marinoscillum sp.]|uniref:restriction endonuclease subunit S n=1 Tax=Marinoscillum sp. TaxID=2024838 RepID=UPI003BABD5E5